MKYKSRNLIVFPKGGRGIELGLARWVEVGQEKREGNSVSGRRKKHMQTYERKRVWFSRASIYRRPEQRQKREVDRCEPKVDPPKPCKLN